MSARGTIRVLCLLVGGALAVAACVDREQCVDPETRRPLAEYGGSCTVDDDCVVTDAYEACGRDCNCEVVIPRTELERFERDWGTALCCDAVQDSVDCDCGQATARCLDGVCGNGP